MEGDADRQSRLLNAGSKLTDPFAAFGGFLAGKLHNILDLELKHIKFSPENAFKTGETRLDLEREKS